jgi:hypothetical protein
MALGRNHLVTCLTGFLLLAAGCATQGSDDIADDDGDDVGDDDDGDDDPDADADGDGFVAADDCDDDDPAINPDADEAPLNGADDDCDGKLDEVLACASGGDFATIQAAIDAAPPATAIDICPGTYAEALKIERSVHLYGLEGAAATIVDAGDADRAVVVAGTDEGTVTLAGLTLRRGMSSGRGGGVRCTDSALALVDLVITDNAAPIGAGVAATDCALTVAGSEITHNTGTASGGGFYLEGSTGAIDDSLIADNAAFRGGGVFQEDGDIAITDCEIRGNSVGTTEEDEGGGAGVYHRSDAPFTGNVVADNVSSWRGAGLLVEDHKPLIDGNTFTGNHSGDDGSGVYVIFNNDVADDEIAITNNLFQDNTSLGDAGGLRLLGASATVANNQFVDNTAGADGGGIKASHDQSMIMDNVFTGNVAGYGGGGLEIDDDRSTVLRCVVSGNRAARGGGIHYNENLSPFKIEATLITGNTATTRGGGIGYDGVETNESELRFVTIAGNTSPNAGGAFFESAVVEVRDSIIAGNSGSQVKFVSRMTPMGMVTGAPTNWKYNDVFPNTVEGMTYASGSNGNISSTPSFVSASDYHLGEGSACRNAGDPGQENRDSSRADMGAYGGPDSL